MEVIAAGAICTQNAGDGPFVHAKGRSKLFSARTSRRGERLGLLALRWCTTANAWRWILTEKGWSAMKTGVVTAASR